MKTAISMQPVASSQIAAIGHCAETNTLAIQFTGKTGPGSLYHYKNFDSEQFAAFAGAESVGKHFYAHIKPFSDKHPYERIEAPAISAQVDADTAADLACCTATAKAMQTQGRSLIADSIAAYVDAGMGECEMTDEAIIEFGTEYNLRDLALIERLEVFAAHARAEMVAA